MALIFRSPRSSNNFFDDMFHDVDHLLERSFWTPAVKGQKEEVINDETKFGVSLDVAQFKPEELKVNLDGRVLSVEGKHESKDQHSCVQRSFTRKWLLPEDIDLAAVRSQLDDKGQLQIEAPKVTASATRNIAIEKKK